MDGKTEIARVTVVQNRSCTPHLSPDGKTLVTTGTHSDNALFGKPNNPEDVAQCWDVAKGKELALFTVPRLRGVTFSPDGKVVAAASGDETVPIQLIDPRTGKTLHSLDRKGTNYEPTAFSPDGKTFALVGDKGTLRWDVATGKLLGVTPPPASVPPAVFRSSAAFDGPDRLIVLGHRDLVAYTWDALGGTVLASPAAGHAGRVRSVTYTRDGKEIVTAADDGAVLRWGAADGKPLGRTDLRKPTEYSGRFLGLVQDHV